MTPEETALLLGKCASIDFRTVGRADVLAWHELVADLPLADAMEAVKRWYGTTRDRIMPSDVISGCRAIRNERAASQPHEVRALPSRFETDEVRDDRVRRGVQSLARLWSVPEESAASKSTLERALERSRRERKGQMPRPARRAGGPGIQLDKVTRGPEWSDPTVREQASIGALHAAGRPCGRANCPTCLETP